MCRVVQNGYPVLVSETRLLVQEPDRKRVTVREEEGQIELSISTVGTRTQRLSQ